ncbi:hypothetical protein ACVRYP_03620 [Streptococcus rifensis]
MTDCIEDSRQADSPNLEFNSKKVEASVLKSQSRFKFVYELDMATAEHQQTKKDQLQNFQEQEELRRKLSNQQKILERMATSRDRGQVESPKKTKEERMANLFQEERKRSNKESELTYRMRQLSDMKERISENAYDFRALYERLILTYQPNFKFEAFNEDIQRNFNRIKDELEAENAALQQEKRKAVEEQDRFYYERIRLANSPDEEGNDEY